MQRHRLRLALAVVLPLATALAVTLPAQTEAPAAVVLELFTSQGCSSCPPADELLRRIGKEPALRGKVLPLAFHVDYWDALGWRDPFSSRAWSERQTRYAHAFGSDRIYTPQAVVGGRAECVGSNEDEILARLEAALRRPAGRLELRLEPAAGAQGERLAVTAAPPAGVARALDVVLVVYENDLATDVARGENARRRLRDDFVVRRLETLFTLAAGSAGESRAVPLTLDSSWRRAGLGVAVFLQDPRTLETFGGRGLELR